MGPNAMILVFWRLSFKSAFSLTWFRINSCFLCGKTIQRKIPIEGVFSSQENGRVRKEIMRSDYRPGLEAVGGCGCGPSVTVNPHLWLSGHKGEREPCNGRIQLSPPQSRGHGCPLPAAGSLRSSRSLDGKQMKLLLPLCPPWSVSPCAVEDGTHICVCMCVFIHMYIYIYIHVHSYGLPWWFRW